MINYDKIVSKIQYWSEYHMLRDIYYFFKLDSWKHNEANRNMICDMARIQPSTFKRNLRILTDKQFLIKVSRGVYQINKDILINE